MKNSNRVRRGIINRRGNICLGQLPKKYCINIEEPYDPENPRVEVIFENGEYLTKPRRI